jgi:hypothetical protein
MSGRTYQQVFGVALGSELKETQGINYVDCAAVKALKTLLAAHPFFGGSKVQGVGPLYRKDGSGDYKHEFNRHHAGLSVDIMLDQGSDKEIALGHNLILLFQHYQSVMKWRSIIYQDFTDNPGGSTTLDASCWTSGGHFDHIHIDWFDPNGVTRRPGTSIQMRLKDGATVVDLTLPDDGIAETITWPAQAETDYSGDTSLQTDLKNLMDQHAKGALRKRALGAGVCTVSPMPRQELPGTWEVAIGGWESGWKGIFVFSPPPAPKLSGGQVYWAESAAGAKHLGKWTTSGNQVQWQFNDEGDFRIFTVDLPLQRDGTKGIIKPEGQGWFEMRKK